MNNAGITGRSFPIWELTDEDWQRVIDVDLTSVFLCCRAAVKVMLRQGSGRIVNIASIAGKEGNPTLVPYSTAKAGVIGLTKALAKEVATRGILVNAVAPAVIGTELLKQMEPSTVDLLVSKIPMGRVGTPEEVAALVAWLASDECSFSTGAVYDLSGGRALRAAEKAHLLRYAAPHAQRTESTPRVRPRAPPAVDCPRARGQDGGRGGGRRRGGRAWRPTR